MAIRPMDMQVNIMKESDNAKLGQKEKIHEEGQGRYAPQLLKEQEIKDENVRGLEKTNLRELNEEEKKGGGGQPQGGAQNQGKKKEHVTDEKVEVKDPDRGTVIDIKS